MVQYRGQQFSEYRLSKYLGGGGFADVYLGEHIYLHTEEYPVIVAVKVLKGAFTNKEIVELRSEAQTLVRLRHPHIVQFLTFSVATIKAQDIPFLVMEYAPNGSLDKRYPQGVKLPLATIVSYVKQLAQALQYAHDQKIVHRDIKPANFLLGDKEQVLLSDFGIAVIAHRTQSWEAQKLVGTWSYAAPEHCRARAVPASDQYSLGVVVYEWLCGSLPFTTDARNPEEQFLQLAYQHNEVPPPPLHEKIPIYPLMEEVVFRALAKKPEDRYPTVKDFADALEYAWQSTPKVGTLLGLSENFPENHGVESRKSMTVAWSPDGTRIASAFLDTIQVWDIPTGKTLFTSQVDSMRGYEWKIAWSPDGTSIALMVSRNDNVHILNALSGKNMHTSPNQIQDFIWLPDSKCLKYITEDFAIGTWNLFTGERVLIYDEKMKRYETSKDQISMLWLADGMHIMVRCAREVSIWELTGDHTLSFKWGPNQPVSSDCFWSPDGRRCVIPGDGKLYIHDIAKDTITTYWTRDVGEVAWSPSGQFFATTGLIFLDAHALCLRIADKTVRIYDATTGEVIFAYSGHLHGAACVAWSPDGTRIASGGFSTEDTVHIWQAIDYEQERLNR